MTYKLEKVMTPPASLRILHGVTCQSFVTAFFGSSKTRLEKLTALPLKVAKYEHQFKVTDEAQKTFVVGK